MGNANKNFAAMVVYGELMDSAIKSEKMEDNSSSRKAIPTKKKEGETQAVYTGFQPNYTFSQL